MADLYVPGEVYTNLRKMIVRRGGVPVEPELSNKEITQQLSQREYIIMSASRPPTDMRGAATFAVVLMAPESKLVRAAATLKKLLRDAMKLKKADAPLEILLITSDPMQERLIGQEETKEKNPGVTIENYVYMIFLVDITAHESSPEHQLVSDDEVNTFCKRYYVQRGDLSKIPSSDPQAVWLGLRPGMVVKIIRPSESAGYAPTYRVCVK